MPAPPPEPAVPRAPRTETPRELTSALASCIQRIGTAVPPELAASLGVLGYERAGEDACRLSLAVDTQDRTLCGPIVAGAVRRVCEVRVAIRASRPDDCPAAQGEVGRDALCVAMAARRSGLCLAGGYNMRVHCAAMATGDARVCDRLDPLVRAPCVTGASLLLQPFERRVPNLGEIPSSQLTIGTPTDAGGDTRELDVFERGAWLIEGHLVLVDPNRGWPSETDLPYGDHLRLGFVLTVPARRGPGVLERMSIVFSDARSYGLMAAGPAPEVIFDAVGTTRGARIAGRIHVVAVSAGIPLPFDLVFDTFVRDVVTRVDGGFPAGFEQLATAL